MAAEQPSKSEALAKLSEALSNIFGGAFLGILFYGIAIGHKMMWLLTSAFIVMILLAGLWRRSAHKNLEKRE